MTSHLATRLLIIAALVATIGCDRITKRLATEALAGGPNRTFFAGTIRIGYVENAGGFLSLGEELPPAWRTAIFTGGTGLLLLAFAAIAIRLRWQRPALAGLVLFVAGGTSNWIDRFLHGRVIDFLNVGIGPWRTGVFNVADVAIMVGAFLLLAGARGGGREHTLR